MKKKTLIILVILSALLIIISVILLLTKKPVEEAPPVVLPESASSSESTAPASSSVPDGQGTVGNYVKPQNPDLDFSAAATLPELETPIVVTDPYQSTATLLSGIEAPASFLTKYYTGADTNEGLYGYNGILMAPYRHGNLNRLKEMKLEKQNLFLDRDMTIQYYKNADGKYCLISGTNVMVIELNTAITTAQAAALRDETTLRRILICSDDETYDASIKGREEAQRIMTSKKAPAADTLIVNGIVRHDLTYYYDQNGALWLPIEQLCLTGNIKYDYYDGLFLPVVGTCSLAFLEYVTDHDLNVLAYRGQQEGTFWHKEVNQVVQWYDEFPYLQRQDGVLYADAQVLARIFGWYVFTGDNLVVVTTDPLDIPEKIIRRDTIS